MDCVDALVKAGADVNMRTFNDQTALIFAVENADEKVLNFILKQELMLTFLKSMHVMLYSLLPEQLIYKFKDFN